jgi:hypothetical protein
MTDREMKSHRMRFTLSKRIQKLVTDVVVKSTIKIVALNSLIYFFSFISSSFHLPIRKIENRKDVFNIESPDPHAAVVRGYFQNPKVFRKLSARNRNLIAGLLELPLAREVKSSGKGKIVIHYRRGDYENNIDTIGLLSINYFLRAVDEARKLLDSNEVTIFSDGNAMALAKHLKASGYKVSNFDDSKIEVAELFRQLAGGSGVLVTSNSSFSWWAGALGTYQKVIYPAQWFKGVSTVPMGLDGWIPLEADWEQTAN